jgi:DNA-binding SARP family transcriptional activator/tetratricopeptide (TPR) repeat protein
MSRGEGGGTLRSAAPDGRVAACVLGGFDIAVGERAVTRPDWQRLSAERLVKLLLVTPGHRVTRESAAEILWPDAPPGSGRANLRKALHFASHALDGSELIDAGDDAIVLRSGRLDLDLDRLRAALDVLASSRRSAAVDAAALAPATDVALELGARELLPDDLYEDWLVGPRERLRSSWLRLALPAARSEAEQGRIARAHEIVAHVLEADPTDEAAHRLAMELYAREGRHHAVRRQYAMCRHALRTGLDADPSPETEEAFARAERSAMQAVQPPPAARLVARQAELQRIEPLLDLVGSGRSSTLVIRGSAGIGKTRLLQEVVAYARASDWAVVEWQATESSRSLAYAPFRVGLARLVEPDEVRRWGEPARSALTTLVPGLGNGSLRFAAAPAFVTALVAAIDRIAWTGPLVLAIDDIHLLDDPSTDVLRAIASSLPDRPVLIAVTYRDDEHARETPPRRPDDIRSSPGLDLALAPLAARDVERLVVEHLGGESVGADVLRIAYDQSAGNPLFCLELVRLWQDDGRVRLESGRWIATAELPTGVVPESVRRIVERRTADLPAGAREVLATAAEMGSEVRFAELAAAMSGSAESLIDAIDTALASGLLVERGAGYAFAHPLYRRAVDAAVGAARREGMHLRIARALAGVEPASPPDVLMRAAAGVADPRPAAEHALAAVEHGEGEAGSLAVAFGLAAGDRARSIFDRANAVTLLERSLAVWRRLPADIAAAYPASAAYVALVELNIHAAGVDAAATEAFRGAVATARGPDELAAAYAACFWLPYRHGDFAGALGILEAGLRSLPPEASVARARIRSCVGWCLVRLRRLDEALAELEAAAPVLVASSDRRGAMQALDFHGFLLRSMSRPEEGIAHLEQSLRLAYEIGDSRGELVVSVHLAAAFTRLGRASPARPHADRALELSRLMGDRYGESVAAWTAAELEDLVGDLDAAMALRREELRLLALIGGNPHNEALSHAHLASLARRTGDPATFRTESDLAMALAARSHDPDYPARISAALVAPEWWSLET